MLFSWFKLRHKNKNKFHFISIHHTFSRSGTLGARDFSSAVSGFCQVFIVTPREKPLEQSTIALMAPIQSLTRLNQLVQILDKTADWLLTTTWGTLNLTDATIGWQE